jgi:hypothetical protein
MRRLAHMLALAYLSVLTTTALAFDNGQYENVPPDIRAWFKSVMAPNGVPCCDISAAIAPATISARAPIGCRSKDNG